MDKKAVMMMTIVKAIVVIALVAILFYFFVDFVIVGKEGSSREVCRTSILLASKSKVLGKPLIESLNCNTDYKTIKSDKPDDIKMEITNEMVDCWYQFGEHGKNFISDWGNKKTWVFLCSRLDFKEGISEKTPDVKGFSEFWANKPLPFKEDMSFYDYFYESIPQNFNLVISTKEPVYVAFIGTKYNFLTDLAKEDPLLVLYLYQNTYSNLPGWDATGVIPLAGTLLADKVYTPDFNGILYVGNSRDVLDFLNADVEEEKCSAGEVRRCIISDSSIYGECSIGEEKCLSSEEWSGECKQKIFPGGKNEICNDNVDNDCDNKIDCIDTENCPAGSVCGESKQCINGQCVGV